VDLLVSAIVARKLAEEPGKSEHRIRSHPDGRSEPANRQQYERSNQWLI